MRRVRSFKPQYRQAPDRAATPPPPAWEPLSPVLPPAARPPTSSNTPHVSARSLPSSAASKSICDQPLPADGVHMPPKRPRAMTYEPPIPSASLPHPHSPSSQGLGSPIEALADAATTAHRSGLTYTVPPRRAPLAASSPLIASQPSGKHLPDHAFTRLPPYGQAERPAKRARSEYDVSPPHGSYQSRPATSHIPGWSYNVEQMVNNGTRMYQSTLSHSRDGEEKRLSDAELLLNFFNVSAHSAQSPPATAKGLNTSHTDFEHILHHKEPDHTLANTHAAAIPPVHPDLAQRLSSPDTKQSTEPPTQSPHIGAIFPTAQTQTPPEDAMLVEMKLSRPYADPIEDTRQRKHQGWPKGKPRGPRSTSSNAKRRKGTPKPKTASFSFVSGPADQLQSPRSLTAEPSAATTHGDNPQSSYVPDLSLAMHLKARRHSYSEMHPPTNSNDQLASSFRAQSVPIHARETPIAPSAQTRRPAKRIVEQPDLICAACKSSESGLKVGDGEQWIGCDGCKQWHHYACAGFSSEREVREVNKFYCEPCRPKFGETTKVRKSIRAHTTVDYAGLNEGVLKTSDDNPEHHYIANFKNGDIIFTPETFSRMPPELISADTLEKMNGFREPILVPGCLNPRPWTEAEYDTRSPSPHGSSEQSNEPDTSFAYNVVVDDGQDKLDMVIPKGLTVRRVAELYGADETVPVIDVKAQEGEGKKWTMTKWADYYEQQGEKPVRNVISLEVSRSRLGRLIRRPKAVRDMDLQDSVWREDDKFAPPPVQFYCLMSVADCFTDFHIDFGGSSVYYHIVKGKKVFFFIPPTKQNLKKYEDWCLSPNQGHEWLGKQVKECYRVDLYPGDTMLIPSGWIHAVWTPEDSLVIGGNFLTRIHYGMQIKVLEIEKNTKVALQFRYPFFQKIMWLTAIKYIEDDPVPDTVKQMLQKGVQFERKVPIYCEPNRFGNNSHTGPSNYNRRYYSKHELEGLSDLLNYIWRTVLISLDKIEVPHKTRNAVIKSIPKGFGEPIVIVREFAMWISWKRGNETIPSWAFSNVNFLDTTEAGEKKLSAAQVKKMERDSFNETTRTTTERSSARIRATDPSPPKEIDNIPLIDSMPVNTGPLTGFLRPSTNNPHITTPKTSQLGPKRVACDACRKRRIRCKHKDEIVDSSKPGMHTIDLSGSYGISVKRRLSDHSITDGQGGAVNGPLNGGPIMADVNGDPYALKSGRVKACADCRKSKRRCIHDEYGNVDPIKANEMPIPRGSATKKRRTSNDDPLSAAKRIKYESAIDDETTNGEIQLRQSLRDHFGAGSSLLQNIAFSAQEALDRDQVDGMPIDPALQAYANGAFSTMAETPLYLTNGDSIMTSIEHQPDPIDPMEGNEHMTRNDIVQGPSIEPLTPGPPPTSDTVQIHTNGYSEKPSASHSTVRYLSSPISPYHAPTISPTTTNRVALPLIASTLSLPPKTPIATTTRTSRAPYSASRKTSRTPSHFTDVPRPSKTPKSASTARKADVKDTIKAESGLSAPIPIDPALDEASRELIKQLQQEEHGLRRRSR